MKLGVSSCLFGELCRYDGKQKKDDYVLGTLSKYFELEKFCPEHLAFGTPRDSMRLVRARNGTRAINNKTGEDLTQSLETVFFTFIDRLEEDELCGFVLKSKSPSCGIKSVKIYEENSDLYEEKSIGLFAQALKSRFPYLPMEEEGRLEELYSRESFIMQVFAYKGLYSFLEKKPSMQDLVEFYSSYKYLLFSKSTKSYKKLGDIIANQDKETFEKVLKEYKELFLKTIALKGSRKKTYNVLEHIFGYFKKIISKEEKLDLLELMREYKDGIIPFVRVVKVLSLYIDKFDIGYLKMQKLLEPYPDDLLNHANKTKI